METIDKKNPYAVMLGKIKSQKKTLAARENGRRGGRPKIIKNNP